MSGRFSPLTAPLPFRDLPLRAPLVFSDCSAHLNFWPAPLSFPLRSGFALMLCSCSHVCVTVNMSRVRYPHKCSVTWYYYTDSCNIRYAPNRRIWHLKFFRGYYPRTPKAVWEAPGVGTHSSESVPQIQTWHYTPACDQ